MTSPELSFYQKFFTDLWWDSKPLGTIFRTDSVHYYYDTGTNKILGCGPAEYRLLDLFLCGNLTGAFTTIQSEYPLDEIISALENIRQCIENEKILLQNAGEEIIFYSEHFQNLRELTATSLKSIMLEITEECNLRCKYCIYNPDLTYTRNHGTLQMDPATALAAIDYLMQHSTQCHEVQVNFFGGEPLLCFSTVRSCIDYACNHYHDRKAQFALTTNATPVNKQIAQYLAERSVKVLVSIDGPQEIHDQNRLDRLGQGTFHRTLGGLKLLVETYGPKASELIEISMVFTPPHNRERLRRMEDLWRENPWLENIKARISYQKTEQIHASASETVNDLALDSTMQNWLEEKFLGYYQNNTLANPFTGNSDKYLRVIYNRPLYSKPIKECYLNGCCLPGVKSLYVKVDGSFHICEQVGSHAPIVGNIQDGLDFETIQRVYVDEYSRESRQNCSRCWASKICTLCYREAFNGDRFDIHKKEESCKLLRGLLHKKLRIFCRALEINPHGLNYLEE